MRIRRATVADAETLAEIGARTFFETFAADNTAEDMRLFLESTWRPDLQLAEIQDPGLDTFIDGRRVTDAEALKVMSMVLNGQINTEIVAACRAAGVPAVGVSGVDAGLIQAVRRPPVSRGTDGDPIDYGFVGDISAVDTTVLENLLDDNLVPIVSPLSADADGTLLNINADTVAAAIAGGLSAEKLILATGAPGLLERVEDPRSLISYIDGAGLKKLRADGSLSDGMLPKVAAIERALAAGVPRVHVISYALADGLLLEVFTNEGTGTLVVADTDELSDAEQHAPGAH
jgi:acetylglutamate kinase